MAINIIKKIHDSAIVLGSGPSINDLTPNHLGWLNSLDKWTLNTFIIHNFIVPDFYNIEVKHEVNGEIMSKLIKDKETLYKNTTWLIEEHNAYGGKEILKRYLNKEKSKICLYKSVKNTDKEGKYHPHGNILASVGCGLTLLLDIVARLQYKTIYFIGVDLYSSEYFWTDNEEYNILDTSKVYYNYCTQPKGMVNYNDSKLNPHLTSSRIVPFMKNFIEYNNINAINLSKKSLLTSFMKTEDIPV